MESEEAPRAVLTAFFAVFLAYLTVLLMEAKLLMDAPEAF